MNNREVDLIQKAIDDSLTKSEQSRFDALMANNGDFRVAYNSHSAVAEALKTVEPLDPPPEIRDTVMHTIDGWRYPRPATEPVLPHDFNQLGAQLKSLFNIRYIATFAAGAVAACLLLSIAYNWPALDSNSVSGTIGGSALPDAIGGSVQKDIEFPGGAGLVEWAETPTGLYVAIDLTTSETVLLRVAFNDITDPAITGVFQESHSPSSIHIEANRVRIEHQGSNRYIIETGTSAEVSPEFTLAIEDISGKTLYSRSMTLE